MALVTFSVSLHKKINVAVWQCPVCRVAQSTLRDHIRYGKSVALALGNQARRFTGVLLRQTKME